MPNAYILNQLPVGYGHAVSLLAEMLVAAGWSYKGSGDGLSAYSATGKVFTGTGTGAGGWNNARAWARLASPGGAGGGREIVLQHNAANGLRVKYSAAATFNGGTPSAIATPSATDERYIQGGATDATPTYCTLFYSTGVVTGLDRFLGAAMSVAPYGFWYAGCRAGGATAAYSALMMDPVTSVPEDPDPVVWYASRSNVDAFKYIGNYPMSGAAPGIIAPGSNSTGCWAHMNVSKVDFISVDPWGFATSPTDGVTPSTITNTGIIRGSGLSPNPFNGKDDALPVTYGRHVAWQAPTGIKGWSTLARWTGIPRATFSDDFANRQWIAVGNLWLAWDGVTPPIN